MIKNTITRRIVKIMVASLFILVLLPFVLYIPWIQGVAQNYLCNYMNRETGFDMSIDRVLLKFPLNLSVDGVKVLDENRDTLAVVGNFRGGVELLPLLNLEIKMSDAELNHGYYFLISNDSSMVLKARLERCKLQGGDIDLSRHELRMLSGELDGGQIEYTAYPYRVVHEQPDTAQPQPWRVNILRLTVSDIDYTMRMLPMIDKMKAHVARAMLTDAKINTGDCTVSARSLKADGLYCHYLAMNEHDAAIYNSLHPVSVDTSTSKPWKVNLDTIAIAHLDYNMKMLPMIDKLAAKVGYACLVESEVDMARQMLSAKSFSIDSADCRYLKLNEKALAAFNRKYPVPVDTLEKTASPSWTAKISKLDLTHSHVIYAISGHTPQSKTLDPDCIDMKNVNVSIDDFYNRGLELKVPIKNVTMMERSGLEIRSVVGIFVMDESKIELNNFHLKTLLSDIKLDAHVPTTMLDTKPRGRFKVASNAKIALQEVAKISPELKEALRMVPQDKPVSFKGLLDGTLDELNIRLFHATIPRYAQAWVSGVINNPLDVKRMSGNVGFDGQFTNINFIKPTLLDKAQHKNFNFPPMAVKGQVRFQGDTYAGNVNMRMLGGQFVGKGSFSGNSQRYSLDANFNNFPIKSLMPLSPADNLTGHIKANGHGFNIKKSSTAVNADVEVKSVVYNHQQFQSLQARVNMTGGKVKAFVGSQNPHCDLYMAADGTIKNEHYVFNVAGQINDFDTKALGLTNYAFDGSGKLNMLVDYDFHTQNSQLVAVLNHLNWNYDGGKLMSENTSLKFTSNDSTVQAYLDNEDSHVDFLAHCNLKEFSKVLERCGKTAQKQLKAKNLDVDELQKTLPPFSLNLKVGPNGLLPRYLQRYDIDFRDVNFTMRNDSTFYVDGYARQLSVGDRVIDTLTIHALETRNKYLGFKLHMGNSRGTWDDFAKVDIRGGAKGSTVDFLVEQHNVKGEMGYRFGAKATLADSVIRARFFPSKPVIAYRDWVINDSNYVDFNYTTNMLDANLRLKSDSSSFTLLTRRTDDFGKEKILLNIDNLKLEEWLAVNPYMPAIGGTLNAKMDMLYDGGNFDGEGVIAVNNFSYDHRDEGDILLNTSLSIDPATMGTRLDAAMSIDGNDVAWAQGSLNDSTSSKPLDLRVQFQRFPLKKANPFIPGYLIGMRGYLEGNLTVTGVMDKPVINGYVRGDSASVHLPRYGSALTLSDDKIPVDNDKMVFKNYRIFGLNNNAVELDGMIDISTMDMLLRAHGDNVQFVGSQQKRWSEVFGKGFVDIDATVRSNASLMEVIAKLKLLSGSNLTYVMQDEVSTLSRSSVDEEMVTFIDPSDSVGLSGTLTTSPGTSAMSIIADLDIEQGAKLGAYLSVDGKDRVTIDGSGRLRYSIDFAGKDNLLGTYTIESGAVRYSPPVISQKMFDITSGSKISWTGDVMNPQLKVLATDLVKTGVSGDDGSSRLVDFLVTAKLANSLRNIDLSFDLSAENDMTVQNELQSMTPAQRSNTAINLLLYNTYSGGSSTKVNMTTTGALFSFLQSQLNSWAASTLKGVDLTFGINQFDSGMNGKSSVETSYSYRLSKSLFNDRFKIVMGGEYSTDASNEQNFSSNLINDISFEYNMNASGTRYFRLFRHTGWESVLEGEITKMGVGYVMKRKLGSLRDFFMFRPFKKSVLPDTLKPSPQLEKNDSHDDMMEPTKKRETL